MLLDSPLVLSILVQTSPTLYWQILQVFAWCLCLETVHSACTETDWEFQGANTAPSPGLLNNWQALGEWVPQTPHPTRDTTLRHIFYHLPAQSKWAPGTLGGHLFGNTHFIDFVPFPLEFALRISQISYLLKNFFQGVLQGDPKPRSHVML